MTPPLDDEAGDNFPKEVQPCFNRQIFQKSYLYSYVTCYFSYSHDVGALNKEETCNTKYEHDCSHALRHDDVYPMLARKQNPEKS